MICGDHVLHDLLPHIGDGLLDRLVVHKVDALLEDDFALIVHHVVEFEQVFARIEVARLDLLLGLFQRPVDPGVGDGLVFLDAELAQHVVHALGAEDAHQVVFKREVEFGGAGVALAARAAAKLVVDAPAFVALGAKHIEPASRQRDLLLLLAGPDAPARLDLCSDLGTHDSGAAFPYHHHDRFRLRRFPTLPDCGGGPPAIRPGHAQGGFGPCTSLATFRQ